MAVVSYNPGTVKPDALPPLPAFCWTLPYQPLWRVAHTLLGREPGVVWLESGDPTNPTIAATPAPATDARAQWSLLGWSPSQVMVWPPETPGAVGALRRLLHRRDVELPGGPPLPFYGGWIGWFGYDLGRRFERLPSRMPIDPTLPDFALGRYDLVLLEDRPGRRLYAAGVARNAAERAHHEAEVERVLRAAPHDPAAAESVHADLEPCIPRPLYERAVERVLRYINAGDAYQVNFAHRFAGRVQGSSAALYTRLRAESPAAYGGYWDLPGAPEVLSVSPELFLQRRGDRVETEPIKGTRPRGAGPVQDAALQRELCESEKEQAELLMIVDLLRNDLGRVAEIGSVRVEQQRILRSHATVHHTSATISARVPQTLDTVDLLAATFPGGSVTGAPKIRAMEILDELEPVRRGPYTGSAGYVGYNGDLALNILIRSMVRRGDHLQFHVGGGIVADSTPAAEYEETLAKGAAMLRAARG